MPPAAIAQIFLGIGAVEVYSHNFKITADTMFEGGRVPGKCVCLGQSRSATAHTTAYYCSLH